MFTLCFISFTVVSWIPALLLKPRTTFNPLLEKWDNKTYSELAVLGEGPESLSCSFLNASHCLCYEEMGNKKKKIDTGVIPNVLENKWNAAQSGFGGVRGGSVGWRWVPSGGRAAGSGRTSGLASSRSEQPVLCSSYSVLSACWASTSYRVRWGSECFMLVAFNVCYGCLKTFQGQS